MNLYASTYSEGVLIPVWVVKLGIGDVGSTVKDRPISSIALVAGYETTANDTFRFAPSDDGYFLAMIDMSGDAGLNAYLEFAEHGRFNIVYTIGEGRSSRPFEVLALDDAADEFMECTDALLERISPLET
ncbi:MAG: hypothetical protein DWQ53_09870 [Microcystis flos-aquae DF17]|nr:MAG: hypothetical protein DWQ53_09870 [Microcystis flos-aquae DF17]